MTYQVLLAARDTSLDSELRALFSESGEFTLAATAGTVPALVAALADREADLVLLHEGLGPAPALAILRDLVGRRPTVAVVLLARDVSGELLSAAMEAGARGVLALPLSYADAQPRLSSAAAWSQLVRRRRADEEDPDNAVTLGRSVAGAGAKGGCGATTVAAQLALVAAREKRRTVCLVDLDLQAGDVGTVFGLTAARDLTHLVDVADELSRRQLAGVLFAHPSGVHVLPAPPEGERAETVTASMSRKTLGVLRTMFEGGGGDCGAVAAEGNLGAGEIADRVLVVSTPDVLSLRAAHRLTQLWSRLQVRKPADCDVLLNRASNSVTVQPALARKVIESPLVPVTVPARFRGLEESVNTGTAEQVGDRRLTRAYTALAAHLDVLPPKAPRPRRRWRGDGGALQSVQYALTLPAVLLLVLFVLQVLLVCAGALVAQRQAPLAARGSEAGQSGGEVTRQAEAELPPGWRDVRVAVEGDQVTVRLQVPVLLPGIDRGLEVSSHAGTVGATR